MAHWRREWRRTATHGGTRDTQRTRERFRGQERRRSCEVQKENTFITRLTLGLSSLALKNGHGIQYSHTHDRERERGTSKADEGLTQRITNGGRRNWLALGRMAARIGPWVHCLRKRERDLQNSEHLHDRQHLLGCVFRCQQNLLHFQRSPKSPQLQSVSFLHS